MQCSGERFSVGSTVSRTVPWPDREFLASVLGEIEADRVTEAEGQSVRVPHRHLPGVGGARPASGGTARSGTPAYLGSEPIADSVALTVGPGAPVHTAQE